MSHINQLIDICKQHEENARINAENIVKYQKYAEACDVYITACNKTIAAHELCSEKLEKHIAALKDQVLSIEKVCNQYKENAKLRDENIKRLTHICNQHEENAELDKKNTAILKETIKTHLDTIKKYGKKINDKNSKLSSYENIYGSLDGYASPGFEEDLSSGPYA